MLKMPKNQPPREKLVLRDRVTEFKRVKASDLVANTRNPRRHPEVQREAFRALMRDVGFAGAELCYYSERNGGQLTLIDGHLRAEELPDSDLPCLITDLNDIEADKLLLTYDPLSALAVNDAAAVDSLLRDVQSGEGAVQEMLANLASDCGLYAASAVGADVGDQPLVSRWEVIVECAGEDEQREMYEHLQGEGQKCRLLTL